MPGRGDEAEDEAPGESIARSFRGRPRFLFTEVALSSISELATRSRFSPSVVITELAGFLLPFVPFEGRRRIVGGESTSSLLRDFLGLDVELEHSSCFSFSFEDLRRFTEDALFFLLKGDFVSGTSRLSESAGDALFLGFLDALPGRRDETEDEAAGESIARSLRGRPRFLFTEVALSSISELATRSRLSPSVVNTELVGCFRVLMPFGDGRRIVETSRLFENC